MRGCVCSVQAAQQAAGSFSLELLVVFNDYRQGLCDYFYVAVVLLINSTKYVRPCVNIYMPNKEINT